MTSTHGSAVNIVAWIAMITMCLAVLTKVVDSLRRNKKVLPHDGFILIAMVMAIGETIAINEGVANGLGRASKSINTTKFANLQKAMYASEMLYIMAIAFSRLTSFNFVYALTPNQSIRRILRIGMLATLLWVVISEFGIAFQCSLPSPWALFSKQCFNQIAFWAVIETFGMCLDICLVAVPLWALKDLQMARVIKISVMGAFSARLIVIPLSILRLVYINDTYTSSDKSSEGYYVSITSAIEMNAAIIVTCIPFLKTFIDSFQHRGMTSDLRHARWIPLGDSRQDYNRRKSQRSLPFGSADHKAPYSGSSGEVYATAGSNEEDGEEGLSTRYPGEIVIQRSVNTTAEPFR